MPFSFRKSSALAPASRLSLRSKSRDATAASLMAFFSSALRPSHHFLLASTIQGL